MQNLKAEEFLEHHGVMGMHWGVRHDPNRIRTGRVTPPRQAPGTERKISSRVANIKYNRIPDYKKASNTDLKKAVARLSLEKQYKDLTTHNNLTYGQIMGMINTGVSTGKKIHRAVKVVQAAKVAAKVATTVAAV